MKRYARAQSAAVRAVLLGFAVAISGLLAALPAAAASQGFTVSGPVPQTGMLVSLTGTGAVEQATTKTAASLVGIAAPNDNNLSLQSGQVNVQTDGVVSSLVSTLGGDIHVGDRISASAVQGIGAKLNGNGWIIGTAQADLTAHSAGAVKTTVNTPGSGSQTVYVASIPVSVKVTYYSASSPANTATSWLQRLAEQLVHKHVSTTALVLSFFLLLVGLGGSIVIISSTIRNGFLAISRQPLSKKAIGRAELRSFGVAAAILAFTLIASFLILRIF